MAIRPLITSNSMSQNYAQVNEMVKQLNREATTKTFKQPGGNAIIQGKLPYTGGYGILQADSDNVYRILIGIAPDGEIDIAASIAGEDITDLYT